MFLFDDSIARFVTRTGAKSIHLNSDSVFADVKKNAI